MNFGMKKKKAAPEINTTLEVVESSGPPGFPRPGVGGTVTLVLKKSLPATGGRPLDEGAPKDHTITLRTTRTRKNAYVKAAQNAGMNLTDWMFLNCDIAIEGVK